MNQDTDTVPEMARKLARQYQHARQQVINTSYTYAGSPGLSNSFNAGMRRQ